MFCQQNMHITFLFLTLLIGSSYRNADACGKRPNFKPIDLPTTSPQTSSESSSNITGTSTSTTKRPTTTKKSGLFLKECSDDQRRRAWCLNGGTCYWIDLGLRPGGIVSCRCLKQYRGKRCEELHTDPEYTQIQTFVIPLAVGLTLSIVLIIVVIILSIWSYKRVRRKRKANKQDYSNANRTAEELKPMNISVTMDEKKGNSVNDRCLMNIYDYPNESSVV